MAALFSTTVNFTHQKNLLPIAILKGITHPAVAATVVIIPTVVHEVDAAIDRSADQFDTFLAPL